MLVPERTSDQDVLGAWFHGVLSSPRVAVLDGEGGGNAVQLAEWLAGTDRVGLKRVLCLRDRRELSARALDRLDKSPTVYLLARRASAVDFPFLPGVPCGQDAWNTSSRCHSRSSRCGRSIRCSGSAMSCPAWA